MQANMLLPMPDRHRCMERTGKIQAHSAARTIYIACSRILAAILWIFLYHLDCDLLDLRTSLVGVSRTLGARAVSSAIFWIFAPLSS